MTRRLCVWFNDHLVGRLEEANNLWTFHYDEAWIQGRNGFDLSPGLPRSKGVIVDGATTRPVQWFFDNLLPEEGARQVMAKDQRFEATDSFAMLAYYGQESAGALTLLAEDEKILEEGQESLTFEDLSQRIRNLPTTPLASARAKRMSLAGAQHKLAVIYRDQALFEPIGNALSTHILKPDHPHVDHYPHTAINEWFVMQLAGRLGLSVPETAFLRIPEAIYIIKRFDRLTMKGEQSHCRHTLDGCQLLSIAGWAKYQASTLDNLNRLIDQCRNKAATRQSLFQWMLFNTLVGNGDAHLKNLSVFCEPDSISLTPHYDLLSTTVYEAPGEWGRAELSWAMGSAKCFREVTQGDLHALGLAIGLKSRYIDRTVATMAGNIMTQALGLLAVAERLTGYCRPTAGEQRHLRLITYGVIKSMVQQLNA